MLMAGTTEHCVLMAVLLPVGAHSGVSLVRDSLEPAGVAARLWLLITSSVLGLDGPLFGGNALLLLAYQVGISITIVQVIYGSGTVAALEAWDRRWMGRIPAMV